MAGTDKTHPIADRWGRIRNFDFCSEIEPTGTWPYMFWINPATQTLKVRNRDNSGWITVGGGGGGDGAPVDAKYLVLALDGDLSAERRFVDGDGLQATDGGPGGDYTVKIDAGDFAGTGLEDDGAENLRIAATAAGDGLKGGGGAALGIDVSDFAGTGLEDDGAENLRIAATAAGDGLQGGAGAALAVDSTVVRTSGPQTIAGEKTFSDILIADKVVDVLAWYDHQLQSVTPDADHFRDGADAVPTGWTEVDGAVQRRTDIPIFSFFYLRGSSTDVSWDYRMQSNITIENLSENAWSSFLFGPILFRDGQYVADVDYYFSIHGETGGVFDASKYVRVHLQWNSAGTVWRVQGESDASDGGGQTASGWTVLGAAPLTQPLFFRLVIRNNVDKVTRQHWGHALPSESHTQLQQINETTTWGQVWWRLHQTRGAGALDDLLIGAVDYLAGQS